MSGAQGEVARIVAALASSRKYRDVAPAVLERVARDSLRRTGGATGTAAAHDAIWRAKRKLHQICAAFVDARALARAGRRLADASPRADEESWRAACREVLALHASTRERLEVLDVFYRELFAVTGAPRRLLDLGCGLHPFALPWMGLPAGCEYVACDLDRRALALIESLFARVGRRVATHAIDLVAELPRALA